MFYFGIILVYQLTDHLVRVGVLFCSVFAFFNQYIILLQLKIKKKQLRYQTLWSASILQTKKMLRLKKKKREKKSRDFGSTGFLTLNTMNFKVNKLIRTWHLLSPKCQCQIYSLISHSVGMRKWCQTGFRFQVCCVGNKFFMQIVLIGCCRIAVKQVLRIFFMTVFMAWATFTLYSVNHLVKGKSQILKPLVVDTLSLNLCITLLEFKANIWKELSLLLQIML